MQKLEKKKKTQNIIKLCCGVKFLTGATLFITRAILCSAQRESLLYYLRTTQCGVLGISSDGLCQLFMAVIFHRPCAQGLSEAWR